jgi:hypothetical protein
VKNIDEKDHLEETGIDRQIIKTDLGKIGLMVRIGFIWLSTVSSCGL